MTKEELQQIPRINKDILRKQQKLKKLKDIVCIDPTIYIDSTSGSNPHFPYQHRNFVIRGSELSKTERLEISIDRLKITHKMLCYKARVYIDMLEDAELKEILSMRYINGLTVRQIGDNMGIPHVSVWRKIKEWEKPG